MLKITCHAHSSNTCKFHTMKKKKIYLKQSVTFHLLSTLLQTEKVFWSQITFQRTEHFSGDLLQLKQMTAQSMYLSSHLSQLLVKRSKKSSISVGRVNEKSTVQAIQIFDLCEITICKRHRLYRQQTGHTSECTFQNVTFYELPPSSMEDKLLHCQSGILPKFC